MTNTLKAGQKAARNNPKLESTPAQLSKDYKDSNEELRKKIIALGESGVYRAMLAVYAGRIVELTAHQQAISQLKGRTKEIEYLKESHEQNYKANPSEGGKFILGWELKILTARQGELEAQLKKLEGKK